MNRPTVWIALCACILAMGVGIVQAVNQHSVLRWPVVPGTVDSFGFERVRVAENRGWRPAYSPVVRYHYAVNGLAIEGHRLTPLGGDATFSYREHEYDSAYRFWSERIKVGGAIAVHVNSRDPKSSYLFPHAVSLPIFLMILPALPLAWCLLVLKRSQHRREEGFWAEILTAKEAQPREWKRIQWCLILLPVPAIAVYGRTATLDQLGMVGLVLVVYFAAQYIWPKFADFAKGPFVPRV